ncbi:hypothetical protein NADFUDRAFT_3971, partial [Nadsonia fulvescens var. elongata DSM 6958]
PYNSMTFGNSLAVRVDEEVKAMSISPSSRDVVLASRRGLFIVDLDDPFSLPRWLHHFSSWEIADVQWSPHASKPFWVASTSNQKAMLWNLALPSSNAIEHVLHGHTRAITDINFHPHDPLLLSTCSVDTFILNWDLRDPSKPCESFSDWFAGASQVKWSRVDPHILASSHEGRVHIWDRRKGSIPLKTIDGHARKINGINFSRTSASELMTCSLDGTVKLWDYNKYDFSVPNYTIECGFPVWRARYTPFGQGCAIMPLSAGNNSIYLTNFKDKKGVETLNPEHVFSGHTEPVHEFIWRSRGGYGGVGDSGDIKDNREFQLVTWSKDHDLRLWPISDLVLHSVHHEKDMKQWIEPASYLSPISQQSLLQKQHSLSLETKDLHLRWLQGVRMGHKSEKDPNEDIFRQNIMGLNNGYSIDNLGEELGALTNKFPKVRFEKINVTVGHCAFSLVGPWGEADESIFVRFEISFPKNYPKDGNSPQFTIEENSCINDNQVNLIKQELDKLAQKFTSLDKVCLEPCLRYLLDNVTLDDYDFSESITSHSDYDSDYFSTDDEEISALHKPKVFLSSLIEPKPISHDTHKSNRSRFDSTPAPRLCGATWDNEGRLICFKRQIDIDKDVGSSTFYDVNKNRRNNRFGVSKFEIRLGPSVNYKYSHRPRHQTRSQLDNNGNTSVVYKATSSSEEDSSSSGYNGRSDEDNTHADRNSDDMSASDYYDSESEENLASNYKQSSRWMLKGQFKSPIRTKVPHNYLNLLLHDEPWFNQEVPIINTVSIHDFKTLIPTSKQLAVEYEIFGKTPEKLCQYNSEVAEMHGYQEIAECWKLLSIIVPGTVSIIKAASLAEQLNIDMPPVLGDINGPYLWGSHPFGRRWLIETMFDHFEKQHNTQMLAYMSCILSTNIHNNTELTIPALTSSIKMANAATRKSHLSNIPLKLKAFDHDAVRLKTHSYSSCISDNGSVGMIDYQNYVSFGNSRVNNGISNELSSGGRLHLTLPSGCLDFSHGDLNDFPKLPDRDLMLMPQLKVEMTNESLFGNHQVQSYVPLLDPSLESRFQSYRKQYASILYSWGLVTESLEILKFNYTTTASASAQDNCVIDGYLKLNDLYSAAIGLRLDSNLESLRFDKDHITCIAKHDTFVNHYKCQYCGLSVRSRFVVCMVCEHILHTACASDWWKSQETQCPSGCGCNC